MFQKTRKDSILFLITQRTMLSLEHLQNCFDAIKAEVAAAAATSCRSLQQPSGAHNSNEDEDCVGAGGTAHDTSLSPTDHQRAHEAMAALKACLAEKETSELILLEKLQTLDLEKEERGRVVESFRKGIASLEAKQKSLEDELVATRLKLVDETRRAVMQTEKAHRLQSELQKSQDVIEGWQLWVADVEQQAHHTERAVQSLADAKQAAEAELGLLRGTAKQLDAAVQELAATQAEKARLAAQVDALQMNASQFDASLMECLTSLRQGVASIESYTCVTEALRTQVAALQQENAALQQLVQQSLLLSVSEPHVSADRLLESSICRQEDAEASVHDSCDGSQASSTDCDGDAKNVSAGVLRMLSERCAMLEGRLVDLTLQLRASEEERDAYQRSLVAMESDMCLPFVDVLRDETRRLDDALVDLRWEELRGLMSGLVCFLHDPFGTAPPEVFAQEQQQQQQQPNFLRKETTFNMASWQQQMDVVQRALRDRDTLIEALQCKLAETLASPPHIHSAQTLYTSQQPAVFATQHAAVSNRQRDAAHVGGLHSVASALHSGVGPAEKATAVPGSGPPPSCAICGWAVEGATQHGTSSASSACCHCRLCGDVFHRRCCLQSEPLFVCHKHTEVPSGGRAAAAGSTANARGAGNRRVPNVRAR